MESKKMPFSSSFFFFFIVFFFFSFTFDFDFGFVPAHSFILRLFRWVLLTLSAKIISYLFNFFFFP